MESSELQESDDMKPNFPQAVENQQKHPEKEQGMRESTKKSIQQLNQGKRRIIGKLEKARHQLQVKKNASVPEELANADYKSKVYLEAIIEGFEQLIVNMVSNNRKLLHIVGNTAKKISILRDLPLFESIEKEFRKENRVNGDPSTLRDNVSDREVVEKNSKQTPTGKFSKYINKMLREHIGPDQKEIPENYKCTPEHIEDLETYANALVQGGYGKIVEEEIRINGKNNCQAFIEMPNSRETGESGGFFPLPLIRRFAFHGDIVRAFVLNADSAPNRKDSESSTHIDECGSLPLDKDIDEPDTSNELDKNPNLDTRLDVVTDKEKCRKAFVIKIIKQTELREVVGSIGFTQPTLIDSKKYFKLRPHDAKIPMVFIPMEMCVEELNNISKEDVCGMFYVARILDIDVNGHCIGELVQPVGKIGCLQDEIKAILLNNNLKDLKPYDQKYLEMFEGPIPPPTDEDLIHREDLRQKCVFTIDPLTAKDLDDAVSVEKLNSSEYEIGVHISDVGAYLHENSELDNLVKYRATSVYLVDRVIHMLPTTLCLRCSLLPGEDKYAFSVFWKWNVENQELSAPRFTRSVVNSCSQLAYEHAQKIIDNPLEDFDNNDLPDVLNEWTPNDIMWRVLLLHQIAQKLKAKRYENGALSINNPKMRFQLDPKTGEPLVFETESRGEANFLVEEFMLLANQSVAKFIHDHFPQKSILRNHSPPLAKSLKALKERLKSVGFDFDIRSSKSLYESLKSLCQNTDEPKAVETCLNALLTKPMARAKYFCSEGKTAEADFWHYGLSIPIYTHFTSPIRRYADVMVHRLLAAALNYCPPPQRTTDELHQLAKIMNDQKFNAKKAGDDCIELYFKRYLKAKQSMTLSAVVVEITQHSVNVVTIDTGHSISISYNMLEYVYVTRNVPKSVLICKKGTNMPAKKLQLFSKLNINLVCQNNKICGSFAIFDELHNDHAAMNCKKTSNSDKILPKNREDNKPSTSTKSKKQKESKVNKKETKVTKKEKKTQDYLAFYAVKN